MADWNANLYESRHGFVHRLGQDVLGWLEAQPGERVLDVGCGTGQLTAAIAAMGATVVGVDSSGTMIERAMSNYPAIDFRVVDATEMAFDREFGAVFSNAALHWVKPPGKAAEGMFRALMPGGRLVIEMGGRGNVAALLAAAESAGRSVGVDLRESLHVNYFPSIAEYATELEAVGFEVRSAELFDRPTALAGDDGLMDWLWMFRPDALRTVGEARLSEFSHEIKTAGAAMLRGGDWQADYRRLRVRAVRSAF